MKKPKSAFSLFEVSIVVLIVGMVLAGASQSDKIIKKFRLSGAQSLTQSSSVAAIKGLAFWIDSTSKTSFLSNETSNNTNLSYWHDINPQATPGNDLYRTPDSHIKYKTGAINSLPAVFFDGTDITTGIYFIASSIATIGNKFTFFIVSQSTDPSSTKAHGVFSNGNVKGWVYRKNGTNLKREIVFSGVNSTAGGLMTSGAEIVSSVYDGTNLELYVNGVADIATTAVASFNSTGGDALYVGSNSAVSEPWQGYIGEIIIYDNVLDTDERKLVEKYLSKKWNVNVR